MPVHPATLQRDGQTTHLPLQSGAQIDLARAKAPDADREVILLGKDPGIAPGHDPEREYSAAAELLPEPAISQWDLGLQRPTQPSFPSQPQPASHRGSRTVGSHQVASAPYPPTSFNADPCLLFHDAGHCRAIEHFGA